MNYIKSFKNIHKNIRNNIHFYFQDQKNITKQKKDDSNTPFLVLNAVIKYHPKIYKNALHTEKSSNGLIDILRGTIDKERRDPQFIAGDKETIYHSIYQFYILDLSIFFECYWKREYAGDRLYYEGYYNLNIDGILFTTSLPQYLSDKNFKKLEKHLSKMSFSEKSLRFPEEEILNKDDRYLVKKDIRNILSSFTYN